ncbi:MAG: hypothetical protein WCD52_11370, partial [Xanthobacteraceae bacterium]
PTVEEDTQAIAREALPGVILPKCEELTDPSTECCPIGFQKMATSTRISPSRQFGRFSERRRFPVKQVSF